MSAACTAQPVGGVVGGSLVHLYVSGPVMTHEPGGSGGTLPLVHLYSSGAVIVHLSIGGGASQHASGSVQGGQEPGFTSTVLVAAFDGEACTYSMNALPNVLVPSTFTSIQT